MLKRFLGDLLDAATLDEDWFSVISTTNDPRTDWCSYPACDDTQLHGKEHENNWSLSTPMTVTQAGYHAT